MSTEIANPPSDVTGVARYVQFVHEGSKKTKQPYLDAGGKLPGFVLSGGGLVVPLGGNKIEVGIVDSVKLLTRKDQAGKIVKGYRLKDFPGKTTANSGGYPVYTVDGEPKPYEEHYFVLALLRTPGSLCPVSMNFFSGPSARGIANAHSNLAIAKDPEKWARQPGPGFADSAKADGPAGRFVSTVLLEVKANPKTGNNYVTGRCSIRPTTKAEVDEYNEIIQTDEFKANALATFASWDRVVKMALGEIKDAQPEEV